METHDPDEQMDHRDHTVQEIREGESHGLVGDSLGKIAVDGGTGVGTSGDPGTPNDNSDQVDATGLQSDRLKKKTPRGQEFEKQTKIKLVRSGLSRWRHTAATAESTITDSIDCVTLKKVRDTLELNITHVSDTYDKLSRLLSPDEEEHFHEKMEGAEIDHLNIMYRISDRIKEIEFETRSQLSQVSQHSAASRSSKSSSHSKVSMVSKNSKIKNSKQGNVINPSYNAYHYCISLISNQ